MGLASYFFTKNVDRTWRLLENLEAGMIGMNTGTSPCLCVHLEGLVLTHATQVTPRLPNHPLEVSRSRDMERSPEKMLP